MNRFQKFFQASYKIFMPYFVLGYPDIETSLRTIQAALNAGCQALELGIPFSDPIADGPVIETAAKRAINQGMTYEKSLEMITTLRRQTSVPIAMLLYTNLIFRRGPLQAYQELKAAGADAILLADCPLEEASMHLSWLKKVDLGAIQLIAPNTPPERAKLLCEHSSAFTYIVSDCATTGVREEWGNSIFDNLKIIRQFSDKPMLVGFGISSPKQVLQVTALGMNGAIMGSALVKLISQHLNSPSQAETAVYDLVHECARVTEPE